MSVHDAAGPEVRGRLLLDQVHRGPSLAGQVAKGGRRAVASFAAAARQLDLSVSSRTLRIAAALILSVPLSTALGASLLATVSDSRAAPFEARAAAKNAERVAAAASEQRKHQLAASLAGPSLPMVVRWLADALPAEAGVEMVGRDERATLTVRIATSDPDLLRAALAEHPHLRMLREVDQYRSDDAKLHVTLRSATP